jgi:hypothetical protein
MVYDDVLISNLGLIANFGSAIFIPLATLVLGRKLLKDKKATGRYNMVRSLIFLTFLDFSILALTEVIVKDILLRPPAIFDPYNATFGTYNILVAMMITIGLTLISYINRLEFMYYTPIVFFTGMYVFYLFTGFDGWIEDYITLGGAASIIFLFFTAIRVKDNGALGIAIFFTLAFSTQFSTDPLVSRIVIISYVVFIVFFSLGLFKPFKQGVVSKDE